MTIWDKLAGRNTPPEETLTPTLETNGMIKKAPLLELVTLDAAMKVYALGPSIRVNDGRHITLVSEESV